MNKIVPESTLQLLEASELDNVDQVKDLLGQGVNPNAQDEYGLTALMVAAGYGGEKVAEHLLSLPTIDTEMRDKEEGWTAMLYAAGHGHLRLLKILLQHGADPKAINLRGDVPHQWLLWPRLGSAVGFAATPPIGCRCATAH